MDLNQLVNNLNEMKTRVRTKDAQTIELFNDVCKLLYLHVRNLATRGDLTMWYQESSLNVLKELDAMLTKVELPPAVENLPETPNYTSQLESRLVEVTDALKKAIEFGEYAEWAVEEDTQLQQLDIDARNVYEKTCAWLKKESELKNE